MRWRQSRRGAGVGGSPTQAIGVGAIVPPAGGSTIDSAVVRVGPAEPAHGQGGQPAREQRGVRQAAVVTAVSKISETETVFYPDIENAVRLEHAVNFLEKGGLQLRHWPIEVHQSHPFQHTIGHNQVKGLIGEGEWKQIAANQAQVPGPAPFGIRLLEAQAWPGAVEGPDMAEKVAEADAEASPAAA